MKQQIKFSFSPFEIEKGLSYIEKSDESGNKKRWLRGIASGTDIDGHGERITRDCIKSFQNQANSGDILLYADKHDVKYTDDIGILKKSEILPNGDWFVEFQLYDTADGVGANTLERADKLWKQINGFPPYKAPKQKGFSIEGYIPENGILQMSGDGRRVINDVELDGCVVVPRPAYQSSVAHSIYKALGEQSPWQEFNSNQFSIHSKVENEIAKKSYFEKSLIVQDAFDASVEQIMTIAEKDERRNLLTKLFDEYKNLMVDAILSNEKAFMSDIEKSNSHELEGVLDINAPTGGDKTTILKSLFCELDKLQRNLEKEN